MSEIHLDRSVEVLVANPDSVSEIHRAGLKDVPEEYRLITSQEGDRYEVFGASKAKHLHRNANEAVTLFAIRNGGEKVAIKIFLGWQTLFPEVKASQFHDEILKIPEDERAKRLEDTPENRKFWVDRFAQHDFGGEYRQNILTAESFSHLLAGPAVSMATMRLVSDCQLALVGYGFITTKGRLAVTSEGNAPEFMRFEDGHPVLVTKYVDGLVLLDDIIERSPQQSLSPGVADLKIFQENQVRIRSAKESLVKAGFTTTDIEVYLNLHEDRIVMMDFGQVMPVSKEAVSACIQSIVQIYNLPEMFVKMLANKYWLYHENRR